LNKLEYLRQHELGDTHWWFTARRNIIIDIIDKRVKKQEDLQILDLGCGTGNMLKSLSKFGKVYYADSSIESIEFCKKRDYKETKLEQIERLSYPSDSFDLVLALDVLEHSIDDAAALKEIFRICKNDGYGILTVPAYSLLWTQHDIAACHVRRYVSGNLRAKLRNTGFCVLKISYFNTLLFLPQFYFRILMKVIKNVSVQKKTNTDFIYALPASLNSMFKFIFELEKYILRKFNLPFGLSLFCLVYKPR